MNLDENIDCSSAAHHGFVYMTCWEFSPLLSVQRALGPLLSILKNTNLLHCLQRCKEKNPMDFEHWNEAETYCCWLQCKYIGMAQTKHKPYFFFLRDLTIWKTWTVLQVISLAISLFQQQKQREMWLISQPQLPLTVEDKLLTSFWASKILVYKLWYVRLVEKKWNHLSPCTTHALFPQDFPS